MFSKPIYRKVFQSLVILSGMLVLSTAAWKTQAQTITAGSLTAAPGQTISVPVNITNFLNVAGFQFELYYDTRVLEFIPEGPFNAHPSFAAYMAIGNPAPGVVRFNFIDYASTYPSVSSGKLLDLPFRYCTDPIPCEEAGQTSALAFNTSYSGLERQQGPAPVTSTDGNVSPVATTYNLNLTIVGNGQVKVGGTTYSSSAIIPLPAGSNIALEAIPMAGNIFSGWSGALSGNSTLTSITMNINKNLTATFAESTTTQYTLTINITGGGSVNVNSTPYAGSRLIDANTTVNLQALAMAGWTFSNWSGDFNSSSASASFVMNSNKTITATFTQSSTTQYTLTINIVGSGSVNVNSTPYIGTRLINANSTVNLQAMAAAGWTFSSWSGDFSSSNATTSFIMNSNKTITATFTQSSTPQYNLTVNVVGNGTVNAGGSLYTAPLMVNANTNVSLEAFASVGWSFSGWSGSLTTTNNPTGILMNGNKIVTATFTENPKPQYTLTVITEGDGVVEVDGSPYTQPITVEEGTILSLNQLAAENWHFNGWGGDLFGSESPVQLTMNADKVVIANFVQLPVSKYILTINTIGKGNITVDGELYTTPLGYPSLTNVYMIAWPEEGWKFDRWSGSVNSGVSPYALTISSNKNITAYFSEIPDLSRTLSIDIIGEGEVLVNDMPYAEPLIFQVGETVSLNALVPDGWAFSAYGGDLESADLQFDFVMQDDTRLTATFVREYRVLLFSSPGTIGAVLSGAGMHGEGKTVEIAASAVNGYQFSAWTGAVFNTELLLDPAAAATSFTMPARQVNLTATYTKIPPAKYSLTLLADPPDIGAQLSGSGEYEEGSQVGISAFALAGYQFTGWTGSAADVALLAAPGAASTSLIMPGRAVALTATYEPIQKYPLTLATDPAQTGATLTGAGQYTQGTQVQISAGQATGYQFISWSGSANDLALLANPLSATTTLNMPARPVHLTATYETDRPPSFAVTVSPDPDDVEALLGGSGSYSAGETVTITAGEAPDYQFDGWTASPADLALLSDPTNPLASFEMPARDVSFTANYSLIPPLEYTLTVIVSGNGQVQANGTPYTAPLTFEEGSSVALSAVAGNGWTFEGWSGDLQGSTTPVNLSMNADKQLTATFTQLSPTTFTITFRVVNTKQEPIPDAIIVFKGNAHLPGVYTFASNNPGLYPYTIIRNGYFNSVGQVQVSDQDVELEVTMVQNNVGLNDPSANDRPRVYPNPATTRITVESEYAINDIKLLNLLGQFVDIRITGNTYSSQLDTSALDKGFYLLIITTDSGIFHSKIRIL